MVSVNQENHILFGRWAAWRAGVQRRARVNFLAIFVRNDRLMG